MLSGVIYKFESVVVVWCKMINDVLLEKKRDVKILPVQFQLKVEMVEINKSDLARHGAEIHRSLLSSLQRKDVQKTIFPSKLSSLSFSSTTMSTSGGLANLELSDGSSLYAKLEVGAYGSKSHGRELAGFKTTGWKYLQSAIICTVEHTLENKCALQRFLPGGPIALVPVGDKSSNIVWTMNPNKSSNIVWTMNPKDPVHLKSMNEGDFVNAVNHAFDYRYGPCPQSQLFGGGDIFSSLKVNASPASKHFEFPPKVVKLATKRMVFPLSLMHANQYVSSAWLLLPPSHEVVQN